ncbi:Deoxycytidine monophosphate (dCMP) deaminase [Collariella sp. IMI 366227]|nr:Deoxycytidine monophosphate (dCMP) deaminase [Collariella sp. IMI 366227]
MFIGICGSICAGKRTIARYLVDHHGFTQLYLEPRTPSETDAAVDSIALSSHSSLSTSGSSSRQQVFSSPDELLEFITKNWRERWVTTDIPNEGILDMYTRRPFFLLISVDAPLTRSNCMKRRVGIKIAQVGIEEVVYSQGYSMDGETAAVFRQAGVRLRQFVPPANGLIHLEKPEQHT